MRTAARACDYYPNPYRVPVYTIIGRARACNFSLFFCTHAYSTHYASISAVVIVALRSCVHAYVHMHYACSTREINIIHSGRTMEVDVQQLPAATTAVYDISMTTVCARVY